MLVCRALVSSVCLCLLQIYTHTCPKFVEIIVIVDVVQVARKLAMVEADLERAEERAEQGEKYVLCVVVVSRLARVDFDVDFPHPARTTNKTNLPPFVK